MKVRFKPDTQHNIMTTDNNNNTVVRLISSDQRLFEVDRRLAERSKIVSEILLDRSDQEETIPIENLSSTVLERIIAIEEVLMKHEGDGGFADKEYRKRIVIDTIAGFSRDSNVARRCIETGHENARKRHRHTDETKESLSFTEEHEKEDVDIRMLAEVLTAADYLNSEQLLNTICEIMVDLIKNANSPEEIRRMFDIESDFTPEEEEKIKQENAWAFD